MHFLIPPDFQDSPLCGGGVCPFLYIKSYIHNIQRAKKCSAVMFLTCSCTSVAPNHQQQCDQQIAKSETSINAMTLAKYWKLDFSELIPGGKQTGCWEEWPEWPWSCFSVKVPHMVHTLYILISCINWAAASSLKKKLHLHLMKENFAQTHC